MNTKPVRPITVKSTVDLLIDRITDEIAEGTYRPGDKLLSEPELAAIRVRLSFKESH